MKQLKFLMIVFTLMMGVSFTSCMGESDPTVSPVATLKSRFRLSLYISIS